MKKSKLIAAMTTLAVTVTGTMSSCIFDPFKNLADGVYGPPPSHNRNKAENNVAEPVYGPPTSDSLESEKKGEDSVLSPAFEFSPEENEPVDVYGPPPSDLIEEPDVELEEEFEPEENEPVCVYGPPPSYYEEEKCDGEEN